VYATYELERKGGREREREREAERERGGGEKIIFHSKEGDQ